MFKINTLYIGNYTYKMFKKLIISYKIFNNYFKDYIYHRRLNVDFQTSKVYINILRVRLDILID